MTRELLITWPDDETQVIYLRGTDGIDTMISRTSHDEHGWAGMDAARYVARAFADVLRIKVVEP